MDEYVVGSIANLISNKKPPKVKLKKQNPKIKEQCQESNLDQKNDKFSSDGLQTSKSKSEKKTSSGLEFTNQNVSVGTLVNKKKDVSLEHKPEVKKPKKRKKSDEAIPKAAETEDVPKPKKQKKNKLNLDQESSFSEKEKSAGGRNPIQENNFIDKQMDFTDFNKNTVFVGNIPISYDKKKVCKVFSKFGEIQSARIRCVPIAEINMNKKVAAIKKKYNPKRNSLVAYVRFKSEDSARAALKANGLVIDGHHLRVDAAEENKARDNSKAVFVGGLPFDIEDDELWEFFNNCGKIESVRVIRDSQTSMGKGFGYVNFDSAASVELALELDGQELKKRAINVKRCMNKKSKNKLNSFDKKKSKEITNKLLSKKGKKFKVEKKKLRKEKFSNDFQGRTANMKHKKKKKLSQTALRQRKVMKILGAS